MTAPKESVRSDGMRKPLRVAIAFAAIFVAVTVMVSAGYRVFEYIFFRPGAGIVTDDGSRIISALERAEKLGDVYVEACSREMNENGEYKLTVITGNNVNGRETGVFGDSITATVGEENYTLRFTNGGSGMCYYVCDSFTDSDSFTLNAAGESVGVELAPIDMTRFATVKYPICHGVTFVMFPLSDGSSMLAYTLSFTPEDDGTNMTSIYAESQSVTPEIFDTLIHTQGKVTVTDVNGGVYHVVTITGSWTGDSVDSQNGYLNGEHIVSLDRRLEADIATITLDAVSLNFKSPAVFSGMEYTIPELGGSTELNDVFINRFGLYDAPSRLDYTYTPDMTRNGDETNTLEMTFEQAMTCDIPYVTEADARYYFAAESELDDDYRMLDWGSGKQYDSETGVAKREYHRSEMLGEESPVLLPGSPIWVKLESVSLRVAGDWTIDFVG